MLLPPPPFGQPTSLATAPLAASFSVVPPTATTHGSDDSYSACSGPVEFWPVSSGLDPASPVDTNTLTPAAASFRNFWCWTATSPPGPPRNVSPRPRLIDTCRI